MKSHSTKVMEEILAEQKRAINDRKRIDIEAILMDCCNKEGALDVDALLAELSVTLPKAASASLKAATGKILKALSAECLIQVDEVKKAEVGRLRKEFRDSFGSRVADMERRETLISEWEIEYFGHSAGVSKHITRDEFQLILTSLHSDREPDQGRKAKLDKAFSTFKKLGVISPIIGKAELKKRGW